MNFWPLSVSVPAGDSFHSTFLYFCCQPRWAALYDSADFQRLGWLDPTSMHMTWCHRWQTFRNIVLPLSRMARSVVQSVFILVQPLHAGVDVEPCYYTGTAIEQHFFAWSHRYGQPLRNWSRIRHHSNHGERNDEKLLSGWILCLPNPLSSDLFIWLSMLSMLAMIWTNLMALIWPFSKVVWRSSLILIFTDFLSLFLLSLITTISLNFSSYLYY